MVVQAAELVAQLNGQVSFASALMVTFPAMAASIGVAILGSKYLESVARQPEAAVVLTSRMFVLAGMIDGIAIISMGVGMALIFTNPFLNSLLMVLG